MPHLNALFQTALGLKQSRHEAEMMIEGTYSDAWKAFRRGVEWANWRLELFKILCRRGDDMDQTSAVALESAAFSLEQIPIGLRKPILLIDCHGFTYSEAAEILGVSVETLTDRLRQGRDHMAIRTAEASPAVAKL